LQAEHRDMSRRLGDLEAAHNPAYRLGVK